MDIPILRILSRKSTLGFGKYGDLSIQQLLDLRKGQYIRWVYYNFEGITFQDDILKEASIFDNDKISKPGRNPEVCDIITKKKWSSLLKRDFDEYIKAANHQRKDNRVNNYRMRKANSKYLYKKSVLRYKNQNFK